MKKQIWFDMDGTLGNLYAIPDWLDRLRAEDPSPYAEAAVLHNMSQLARKLNQLQKAGWQLGIVSWLSKVSSAAYDEAVTAAKLSWLDNHLHSVHFDIIHIVAYGRNKWELCGKDGILFDDEEKNRTAWANGYAYHPDNMMKILDELLRES